METVTCATSAVRMMTKNPETIQGMFSKIADSYDFTNGILSFQLYRFWNQKLSQQFSHCNSLLDLCSGTGEIAYRWLKSQKNARQVYMLDFCEQMLNLAESKSLPYYIKGHKLNFLHADATCIPLAKDSVDGVSLAYGIRNIQNPLQCFEEAFRVLKPHGRLAILELTEPSSKILKSLHRFYLTKILPKIGGLISKEPQSYEYLSQSIASFTKPTTLKEYLHQVGFPKVKVEPLTFGIATLITANK